jgi:hypothetical protein
MASKKLIRSMSGLTPLCSAPGHCMVFLCGLIIVDESHGGRWGESLTGLD